MDFHPPMLKRLLLVMAMGVMALSAGAQQSGQSIIFSSPQTDDTQSATPSLAPDSSPPITLPGMLQAPVPVFNFNPPSDRLPMPMPPADSAQQQRMKKLLEERKNWSLMTPEEMLGMTPSEQMLQPPERDVFGQEKSQTPMERYLERESRLREGPTNNWQNDQASSPWNFSHDQDKTDSLDSGRDSLAAVRSLSQLLNGQHNRDDAANPNGSFSWDALNQPLPQTSTKPDLEQLAAMERFRQFLAPSPAPATEPSPDSRFFPVPKPAADPFITQPDFVPNPVGTSFTPLSSGITRPSGLTPLPGVVTSYSQPAPVPSWKPQPPPWLLQGPQPFVMPKQKGF